mmetsp:Transcript_71741/g.114194  ORF Transcript_71741/g.114194 Transcript_71741/m.114194 type:complete len:234 (+) Transcript_71741:491-1192(+)
MQHQRVHKLLLPLIQQHRAIDMLTHKILQDEFSVFLQQFVIQSVKHRLVQSLHNLSVRILCHRFILFKLVQFQLNLVRVFVDRLKVLNLGRIVNLHLIAAVHKSMKHFIDKLPLQPAVKHDIARNVLFAFIFLQQPLFSVVVVCIFFIFKVFDIQNLLLLFFIFIVFCVLLVLKLHILPISPLKVLHRFSDFDANGIPQLSRFHVQLVLAIQRRSSHHLQYRPSWNYDPQLIL